NFLADGTDVPVFFQNLAIVRARALASHTPFGQYIQAISFNSHRTPTGPEKRWAALHTLAYGGTSVLYFTYWEPDQTAEQFGHGRLTRAGVKTAQYDEAKEINRSVQAIGKYLAAARYLPIACTDRLISLASSYCAVFTPARVRRP